MSTFGKNEVVVAVPCDRPLLKEDTPSIISRKFCTNCTTSNIICHILVWFIAVVCIGLLFGLSLYCDDEIMAKQGKEVDATFKGHEPDIHHKPGCYINGDTIFITTLHLIGGTAVIVALATLVSFFICKKC